LDLDIIYYDDIISSIEEIVIPHPRMHERLFVLEPLNEIAPFAMHPVFQKRSYELLDCLKKSSE
jgi:dihydroneopterin aldolase / 2-amino-4-hydroxy-6-hydroxymethyldihydropteridine diphosphokinase